MVLSPFVRRAQSNALPVKDLTSISTPDLIRMMRGDPDYSPGDRIGRGTYNPAAAQAEVVTRAIEAARVRRIAR